MALYEFDSYERLAEAGARVDLRTLVVVLLGETRACGEERCSAFGGPTSADSGRPATSYQLRIWLARAQRRARLRATGGLHVLRHTFCSRLAMRGAPVKAIQELAGHADLGTTLGYMHLSPAARQGAIALLNERPARSGEIFGEILKTAPGNAPNPRLSR